MTSATQRSCGQATRPVRGPGRFTAVAPGQTSLRRIEQPLGALVPGRTVQASAVLTGPAPAGGLKVSLKSDNPAALSVPAFVTVPAGAPNADTITKAEEDDINQRVRSNLFTWEQNPQTGALLMHPLR